MTFGQKLQQLRRARGMSQEDLAGQLSVTRQTISKWELDQSTPDLPYLAAISEFFGVTTDYLIKSAPTAEPASPLSSPSAPSIDPRLKVQLYAKLVLGGLLLLLGAAGVLCFFIISALDPWTYHDGFRSYDGLMGYLLAHPGSQAVFWLLVSASVVGIIILIWTAWFSQIKAVKEVLANTSLFKKEDDQ